MSTNSTVVKQWVRLTALMLAGFIAFAATAFDESPDEPQMSFATFAVIKACALIMLGVCVLTGKHLNRRGLLPRI